METVAGLQQQEGLPAILTAALQLQQVRLQNQTIHSRRWKQLSMTTAVPVQTAPIAAHTMLAKAHSWISNELNREGMVAFEAM